MSAEPSKPNKKQTESVGKFLRDVIIVAVILAGGFGFYWNRTTTKVESDKKALQAKELLGKDNPQRYIEAEKFLLEVVNGLDSGHEYSLASLAELNAILAGEHGIADRKAKAEDFTKKAEAANAELAERYTARTFLFLADGKGKEAEAQLRAVIEKGASSPKIFHAFGLAQRSIGQLEAARRSFKAAYDSDWRNPRFACAVAESYLEDGDFNNAAQYFKKGLDANSEHTLSRIGMARAAIKSQGASEEAKKILDAIVAQPDDAMTPNLKARAAVAQAELALAAGNPDEAVAAADRASAADPKFAPAYAAKGLALAAKKDAGAAAAFDKAIETDAFVASFYWDAANALIDAGLDGQKALSYLEKFPVTKDDRHYLKYGDAYRKLGKNDEAIAQYNKAIEENGMNGAARLNKALVQAAMGKPEDAAATLEEAIALQEFFPDAHAEKGKLLFAKKDWEGGLQAHFMALTQWQQSKLPKDKLAAAIASVKDELTKQKQKQWADVWTKETATFLPKE